MSSVPEICDDEPETTKLDQNAPNVLICKALLWSSGLWPERKNAVDLKFLRRILASHTPGSGRHMVVRLALAILLDDPSSAPTALELHVLTPELSAPVTSLQTAAAYGVEETWALARLR